MDSPQFNGEAILTLCLLVALSVAKSATDSQRFTCVIMTINALNSQRVNLVLSQTLPLNYLLLLYDIMLIHVYLAGYYAFFTLFSFHCALCLIALFCLLQVRAKQAKQRSIHQNTETPASKGRQANVSCHWATHSCVQANAG